MGGTSCKGSPNGNKAIVIAILGLDNAGKTTTARVLEKETIDTVAPTMGYSQSEIVHKNEKIKLIDLGGAKTFRDSWRHYYDDAYGFVYVLDSSEGSRLGENRDVLKRLLQEEKVKGKPILILANKQDKADALDKNAILEDLKIERLVNDNRTLCRVELCSAKSINSKEKHAKIDDSIRHGFDWLIKVVYENYDTLHRRVENDVQIRQDIQQKEKRERQERVKKLRDEQDKLEAGQDDNENDETVKNGFVPIGQAVKNAERNSSDKSGKSTSNNADKIYRPIPAPRSSSRTRKLIENETNDDDEEERPRRHSSDISPRQRPSPVPRSESSRFDDNEPMNSNDEQTSLRVTVGKKKKLIGPPRHRLNGDNLPPLAPSSSASRREDFPQNKGPPVSTPRPPASVAQWAITSPKPLATADKLTSILSDNELDADEDKYRSQKSTKRFVSPHPTTTNQIRHEKKANYDDDDFPSKTEKKLAGRKHRTHRDDDDADDDDNNDGRASQRSSSARKRHDDDDDDEFENERRNGNNKERDRSLKQRRDRTTDNDDYDTSERRAPSSARKIAGAGDSSSRSRTNRILDVDQR